jgi:hypothetical protein
MGDHSEHQLTLLPGAAGESLNIKALSAGSDRNPEQSHTAVVPAAGRGIPWLHGVLVQLHVLPG